MHKQSIRHIVCTSLMMLILCSSCSKTPDEKTDLGVNYLNGTGVTLDYKKAYSLFKEAADKGSARAQNNIGVMYANGYGIPKDYKQAAFWYQKAAEQGLVQAQVNIGDLYFFGDGVAQDYNTAISWYQKAAKNGDKPAQMKIDSLNELTESTTHSLSVIFTSNEIVNPNIFQNYNVRFFINQIYLKILKTINILLESKSKGYVNEVVFQQQIRDNYVPIKELMTIMQPQFESSIIKYMALSESSGALDGYLEDDSYSLFNGGVGLYFWGNHGFFDEENRTLDRIPDVIKAIYIIETTHEIQAHLPKNVEVSPYNNYAFFWNKKTHKDELSVVDKNVKYVISTFMGTHKSTLFGETQDKLQGDNLMKEVNEILTKENEAKLNQLLTMLDDNKMKDSIKVYFIVK